MPHLVTREISVTEIREGDRLDWNGRTYVAGDVSRKQKYVHVDAQDVGDGSRTLRIPVDAMISISRMEKTDEEAAAAKLAFQESLLNDQMDGIDSKLAEAKTELTNALVFRPSFHVSEYEKFVKVQTHQEIWIGVRKVLEHESNVDKNIVDVVRETIVELTDELLRSQFANGSTSGMTNAVENVARQAKADWIRDMKFYVR